MSGASPAGAAGRAKPLGLAEAIREGTRLTERDHQMIVLLAEHKAMTADQLGRILFPSMPRARQRLLLLTQRGILARFRRYHPLGSLPWTYTLGLVGAIVQAAATGQDMPTPGQINTRIVRLHHAPGLPHLLGVTEFFSHLHAAARYMPGAELTRWWSETTTAAHCAGIVRPDGYGRWIQHPTPPEGTQPLSSSQRQCDQPVEFEFFYEHDRGSEPVNTLLNKLDRYEQLAAAGIARTVLIQLPNLARETRLHHAMHRRYGPQGPRGVPVATAHTLTATPRTTPGHSVIQHGPTTTRRTAPHPGRGNSSASPAGPIWRPYGTHARSRLAALATLGATTLVEQHPWTGNTTDDAQRSRRRRLRPLPRPAHMVR